MNFKKIFQNQMGAIPLLFLVSAVGLVAFLLISNTFSFKNNMLNKLFPKLFSHASEGIDLDVTYISRTPRYPRYDVIYENDLPKLKPGTENDKRFPDVGENVTYTAHIINKGSTATSSASFKWLVDGAETSAGTVNDLTPGQERTIDLQIPWSSSPQTIEFMVDPQNQVTDIYKSNNLLKIGSRDLTISIWVEKGFYDLFNTTQNMAGTYSFEDWIQAQYAKMNERFSQAKYPASPNGVIDRIRIDKIVIGDEFDSGVNPFKQDPDEKLIDGRWPITDGDPTNAQGKSGIYQSFVSNTAKNIDWGLIHESGHQLGLIDLYRMNTKNNEPASPNGGIHVLDINGKEIPYGSLLNPNFTNGGIMGGGDITPYTDGTYFESHSAAGLNSNQGQRRGFFGEYIFDTPNNTSVQVIDANGNPLSGAQVNLYQKDINTEDVDNNPEQGGITDNQGVLPLANKPVTTITTATGHTHRANPFGLIPVTAQNGRMLVKVVKDNKEGYGFLTLHDLNLAYWNGNKENAVITVKTNYPKVQATNPIEGINVALNKPVTASSQAPYGGWEKERAVDGKNFSAAGSYGWSSEGPTNTNHIEWISIDLGAMTSINKINVYPRSDQPGLFFPKDFNIQISTDNTNWVTLVSKTNYPNPGAVVQTFTFDPVNVRYVKFTATNLMQAEGATYRVQLAEIEVYSPIPSPTPIPAPAQNVTVTYPNGGEIFNLGETIKITWQAQSRTAFNIGSTTGPGNLNPITFINDSAARSYDWKVGGIGILPGQNAKLKIQILSYPQDSNFLDESDGFFTVFNPVASLSPSPSIPPGGGGPLPTPTFNPTPVVTPTPTPIPTPVPDTTAPTVSISSPQDGASVSGIVNIQASATDNVGVSKYEIYVDGLLSSSTNTFSWDTTPLQNGAHSIEVVAYDSSNNQGSKTIGVNVANADTKPPSKPENLSSGKVTFESVELSWNPSTDDVGVTGYYIVRDGVTIDTTAGTRFADLTVIDNRSYQYQIIAFDKAGNFSDLSSALTVSVPRAPDTQPPSKPGNLVGNAISMVQVNLSWAASTDNFGVAGYEVYRNNTKIASVTTTSFGDSGLTQGTAYPYFVKAFDGAGNYSDASNTVNVTTPVPTPVPTPTPKPSPLVIPTSTPVPQLTTCFGLAPTIRGQGVINGTLGRDVIIGSTGPDTINGQTGDDVICGGGGNDKLDGGSGNDKIDGGSGNDTLSGSSGNDTLFGGEGVDTCDGASGNDTATTCEKITGVP